MVRIRSEHAIGYLKGRFQSLKGLQILIRDQRTHKFATYWIVACICVHAFAIFCEEDERNDNTLDERAREQFIEEGRESSKDDGTAAHVSGSRRGHRTRTLAAARQRREDLKSALFRAKENRRAHRQSRHMLSDSNSN
jgi:hypothetical protein